MTGAGRVGVIVVAAGSGSRLGAGAPKAFVLLAGEPILAHALRGVLTCAAVDEVVVVVPEDCRSEASTIVTSATAGLCRTVRTSITAGGAERGDSVVAGLRRLSEAVDIVLVHDAARCLTPTAVFDRVMAAVAAGAVAVVPGVSVVDTIKTVDADGLVVHTPERIALRAVQTPQGFRRDVLEQAHAGHRGATDDAGLVERLGLPVLVVEGDARSIKVTAPADLEAAARLLAR